MLTQKLGPTTEKERHLILDVLRGLALADIALANFPEFALWTFLSPNEQAMMPTAEVDKAVRFLQFAFVDGKFYTIFSILFGIGFSLILARRSVSLFLRRMLILACIGFCHLMFIWSGDILLLYALGGLLLPLFIKMKDKVLMVIAGLLIFVPVVLDALTEFVGIDFSGPFYDLWWAQAAKEGITEANFASWLRDADGYAAMFAFLKQGACERLWEIVSGHRLPKVLGLFIIGFLIGRHWFYSRLRELPLKLIFLWTLVFSLPASLLYAWSVVEGHPWGLTVHSLLYAVSVIPMSFSYIAAVWDGANVLHHAVGDRRHLVLRLGIWTWHNLRTHHHRTDGRHRLLLPDSCLQVVASLFSFRPARVDLAHAYLRPLLPHILEGCRAWNLANWLM